MRISELIEKLEQIRREEGEDRSVFISTDESTYDPQRVIVLNHSVFISTEKELST